MGSHRKYFRHKGVLILIVLIQVVPVLTPKPYYNRDWHNKTMDMFLYLLI